MGQICAAHSILSPTQPNAHSLLMPTCGSHSPAPCAMLAFNDWWATLVSSIPSTGLRRACRAAPCSMEFGVCCWRPGTNSEGYKNVSQAPQTETKRERNEKQARTPPRIRAGKENPIPPSWTFLSIGIEASLAIHGLPLDARAAIRTVTGPTCWPEPNQSLVRLHGASQNHQAAMANLDATPSLGTPCQARELRSTPWNTLVATVWEMTNGGWRIPHRSIYRRHEYALLRG
jgi:hypothetical protein